MYRKIFSIMKDKSIWSLLLAIGYVIFKMIQVFGKSDEANETEPESPTYPPRPWDLPKDVTPEQQPDFTPTPILVKRKATFEPVPMPPKPYTERSQTALSTEAYTGRKKLTGPTEQGNYPGIKRLTRPTQTNSYPGRALLTLPTGKASYPEIKKYRDSPSNGSIKTPNNQQKLSSMLKKHNLPQQGLILTEIFNPKYGSC
jgi:hypothetical protein